MITHSKSTMRRSWRRTSTVSAMRKVAVHDPAIAISIEYQAQRAALLQPDADCDDDAVRAVGSRSARTSASRLTSRMCCTPTSKPAFAATLIARHSRGCSGSTSTMATASATTGSWSAPYIAVKTDRFVLCAGSRQRLRRPRSISTPSRTSRGSIPSKECEANIATVRSNAARRREASMVTISLERRPSISTTISRNPGHRSATSMFGTVAYAWRGRPERPRAIENPPGDEAP